MGYVLSQSEGDGASKRNVPGTHEREEKKNKKEKVGWRVGSEKQNISMRSMPVHTTSMFVSSSGVPCGESPSALPLLLSSHYSTGKAFNGKY